METKLLSIILDFTDNGSLPAELLRRLDVLAETQREDFNGLLAELTRGREHNIDWWVSRPACRNTHISILFAQCMQLALVRALLDEGANLFVRTDRPELAHVLRPVLGPQRVKLNGVWASFWHALRNTLWNIGSTLYHVMAPLLAARWTQHQAKPRTKAPMLVLDTFLYGDSFGGGEFYDFHYPSLYESLDDSERGRLYYFPIFYRIRDYLTMLRDIRNSNRNFLVREDHLRWSDYAFAFGHWWRVGQLAGRHADFMGFDIGPLVDAELRAGKFANSVMQALLHYRFWCGAKGRDLTVERLIDWYEGHDYDHATAAAINWYAHAPMLVAFRPIAPLSYLSVTPARHEVTSGVVPSVWGVVGGSARSEIESANPELAVLPASGLRHTRLREFQRRLPDTARPVVLVLLSTELELIERLVAMIAPVLGTITDYRWLIKRHPATPLREATAIMGPFASAVEIVDGDIYDWLASAGVVIGLGTNTLIEAAAAGVPVICVSGGNRPMEVPLPHSFKAVWWRLCYDAAELAALLPQAIAAAQQVRAGPELLEALLGPIDVKAMHALLFDALPQRSTP